MDRRPVVLLADDDTATRDAVASLLEDEGYDVLHAADGFAVLDVLGRQHPDFMLVDLRMPGFDGRELIHALDGSDHPMPLIAMTASAPEPEDAEIPHTILRKPFGAEALLAAIATVCPRDFDSGEPSTDKTSIAPEARAVATDTSKQKCGACERKAVHRCESCGGAFCAACTGDHEASCADPTPSG